MSKKHVLLFFVLLVTLVAQLTAQSEKISLPEPKGEEGVTFSVFGGLNYFHRHRLEIEGVAEHEQAIYQGTWSGELGLRIEGLKDEPHRVHLAYVELDLNAPARRVFDILLNGEVVKKEVCVFNEVGNRRVLGFDFTIRPENGAIVYEQRKSLPEADVPSFRLIRLYDASGKLVAERSAWEMRPADWDLHGYLDKIYFGPIRTGYSEPPWEGSYKIRKGEEDKLTAADVMGPDGIAYPNWTQVGIPGGIPILRNTLSLADFGAVADDEKDDSAALQRGIDEIQKRGGGVLFIPDGLYYLDRSVTVTGDNVVLRGNGASKTRFISRISMEGKDPEVRGIGDEGRIGSKSFYYAMVDPNGLTGIKVTLGKEVVFERTYSGLWEQSMEYRFVGADLFAAKGEGKERLTVAASYRDGSVRKVSRHITIVEEEAPAVRAYGPSGIISFRGSGLIGGIESRILLAEDGQRGDMSLHLQSGHDFQPGDKFRIAGPTTEEWNTLLRNDHKGGDYRSNYYEVESVEGDRIFLGEALRIKFPIVDGSYVQKARPLLSCGIEDLTLEQGKDAFIHGILMEYGWECWVQGVNVVKGGNKSLYMPNSKRCEVRDSVFDRVWHNFGGAGYIGWEHSYDCLMENVTAYDMRHAPVYQWASSGNVIRKSVFYNSDAQWHAGWTNENLYEEVVVESSQDGGSYGNGMWASGPEDMGHGPNGPRNVIYNCNITSSKVGLWMGGMNENWLIMYNRFIVGRGPAILAKVASFDHIIQGNTFVLMEPYPAAIYIGSADCIGIELRNNRFFGPVDQLVEGEMRPEIEWDNRILKSGNINRPQPEVRSIFEWQKARKDEIQATQRELYEKKNSKH